MAQWMTSFPENNVHYIAKLSIFAYMKQVLAVIHTPTIKAELLPFAPDLTEQNTGVNLGTYAGCS